jgi:hypothetical protein
LLDKRITLGAQATDSWIFNGDRGSDPLRQ